MNIVTIKILKDRNLKVWNIFQQNISKSAIKENKRASKKLSLRLNYFPLSNIKVFRLTKLVQEGKRDRQKDRLREKDPNRQKTKFRIS